MSALWIVNPGRQNQLFIGGIGLYGGPVGIHASIGMQLSFVFELNVRIVMNQTYYQRKRNLGRICEPILEPLHSPRFNTSLLSSFRP